MWPLKARDKNLRTDTVTVILLEEFIYHIYKSQNKLIRKYTIPDNIYRKTSNIRRTLVSNKIVDHSDVVGASPVGAAPTTSSFST